MKTRWTEAKYWPDAPLDEHINETMVDNHGGSLIANEILASKSPRFAELLIRLATECMKGKPDYLTVAIIAGESIPLLKECGWEEYE